MNAKKIIFLFIFLLPNVAFSDLMEKLLLIEEWTFTRLRQKFIERNGFYEYSFNNENFSDKKMEIYFRFSSKNDCIIKRDNNFFNDVQDILSYNNIKEFKKDYKKFVLIENKILLEYYDNKKYIKKAKFFSNSEISNLIDVVDNENKIILGEIDGVCFSEIIIYTPNRTLYLNLFTEKLEKEIKVFNFLTDVFGLNRVTLD